MKEFEAKYTFDDLRKALQDARYRNQDKGWQILVYRSIDRQAVGERRNPVKVSDTTLRGQNHGNINWIENFMVFGTLCKISWQNKKMLSKNSKYKITAGLDSPE